LNNDLIKGRMHQLMQRLGFPLFEKKKFRPLEQAQTQKNFCAGRFPLRI
jgi:hypothetical protein